jgi:D-amino peptidase
MQVYISVDMEGCSGVIHREHTNPKGYDYELARRLMTAEADAAVRGAFDAGADAVVVSDSHGGNGMRNILHEQLDPRAELVMGSPRRLGQLEGLDADFDAVLLVGYHTRHGAAGNLSHTTNGQAVANLWIDGALVGEIGLNARLAGHFGVPIAMVTGDDLTVVEAKAELPDAEGVVVKTALGRYSARCVHPERACELIRVGATRAVRRAGEIAPSVAPSPVTFRLQFKETGSAESAARALGASQVADDTIAMTCSDMEEAYAAYSTLVELWQGAWGGWIRG